MKLWEVMTGYHNISMKLNEILFLSWQKLELVTPLYVTFKESIILLTKRFFSNTLP